MSAGPPVADVVSATVTPLVVSRFAVRIAQAASLPDEAWMRQRTDLLRRFTLPSLERAGWPGLRWALLVDPDTAGSTHALLDPMLADCKNVRPAIVRVDPDRSPRTAMAEDLDGLCLTTERVASIRLDTDDVLLPGAVEQAVRIAECSASGTLIDLYYGYQYDVRSGRLRTHAKGMQGPFLALVNDRASNPIDAAEFHTTARTGRNVRYAHGPTFVQVIHATNVVNSLQHRRARSRVMSPVAHWTEGGGVRRAWVLATSNRDVPAIKATRILRSCGIDPSTIGRT
jgi:hypothetical protein